MVDSTQPEWFASVSFSIPTQPLQVLGESHPITLTAEGNYARILSRRKQHAEAAAIQRKVLCAQREVLGAEHPDSLRTAARLGVSIGAQGNAADAMAMLHEALVAQSKVLGAQHPDAKRTLAAFTVYACVDASMEDKSPEGGE